MKCPSFARRGPRRLLAAAALAVLALLARPAAAQQADTVAGRVMAADSTPIPQARVRLVAEGGREQAVQADAAGAFRFVVPGGPGAYVVTASAFGYVPFTAAVQREPGATRITRNLRLSAQPLLLEAVTAVAVRPGGEARTAGEQAARWTPVASEALPVDPGSFADVAALEPGIARVGEDGAGLSVAGQSPDQNGATVDGATFGGGSLPAEGVGGVSVFTSSYDVSRGQFSGGQVAATTLGGTNLWGGSLSSHVEDPALRYGGAPAAVAGRPGRRVRLSGGGGGAVVRDRLFVYGALDVSRGAETATGLEWLGADALRRLGVAPDSARRLIDIARRLGAAGPEGALAGTARRDFASALARVDWAPSRSQSVTARLDWRGFDGSGFGSSPLRLAGSAGEHRTRNGGVMLEHTAWWGRWANELRVYRSAGHSGAGAGDLAPAGIVRVSSTLDDGAAGTSALSFGGVPFAMRDRSSLWELANELKLTAPGGHLLKAGVLLQEERAASHALSGRGGIFIFNGLADLEAGRPASYTRNLAGAPGQAVRRYASVYVGDSWTASPALRLVMGVRADATSYGRRPALSTNALPLAGPAAGQVPGDLVVTPRFGFRYDSRGRGRWTFEGGAGGFAGVHALAALASRWSETGQGQATLVCVGPAAPTPEWGRYAADPGAVPNRCADEGSPFSASAPRVTAYHPSFAAPRTWRGSLGASGQLTAGWGLSMDALLVHGSRLPSAVDLNLHGRPAFSLAGEGGRPVFAGAGEIDPSTGGVAPGAARTDGGVGSVLQLGSRGRSWTGQFTAGVNGFLGRGHLGLYYTHTRARTLVGGVPAPGVQGASTAGDPARLEWADAPFAPRHLLQTVVSARPAPYLRLSAVGRLSSGLPFTPFVSGDPNGDGYQNDRAFVFGPGSATDPALAAAMGRLMDEAPAGARRCLREQAGRIAGAASCRTAWSPSLDLRAEVLARGTVNTRRLAITVTAQNVTAGLDYLLHGPDGLRGWGQYPTPDATLLRVRGFDAARGAFDYEVNPGFGRPLGGGAARLPFRVAVQARVTVGADPRYQPMMRAIELSSGQARESIRADLAGRVRNVPAMLLRLDASDTTALGLTALQRARLRALADSLAPRMEPVVDSLAGVYAERGPSTPARRARLQELAERVGALVSSATEQTRALLTPEQWGRVPAWLARPPTRDELDRPPSMKMSLPTG